MNFFVKGMKVRSRYKTGVRDKRDKVNLYVEQGWEYIVTRVTDDGRVFLMPVGGNNPCLVRQSNYLSWEKV